MKRTIILLISTIFILTACSNDKDKSSDQEADHTKGSHSSQVKQVATDKNVQGDNYRTILPFKESQSRGLLQDNMANSYNSEGFESGLLELSKKFFLQTNTYIKMGNF